MALTPLSKLKDYKLADEKQNVRGWQVKDAAGSELGKVEEMIVDTEQSRIATLRLDTGRWVPVKDVTLGDKVVMLHEGATAGDELTAPRANGPETERNPTLPPEQQHMAALGGGRLA